MASNRRVWVALVDGKGFKLTSPGKVNVSPDSDVDDIKQAVEAMYHDSVLARITPTDISVYVDQAAFARNDAPLAVDAMVEGYGEHLANPILVVAPFTSNKSQHDGDVETHRAVEGPVSVFSNKPWQAFATSVKPMLSAIAPVERDSWTEYSKREQLHYGVETLPLPSLRGLDTTSTLLLYEPCSSQNEIHLNGVMRALSKVDAAVKYMECADEAELMFMADVLEKGIVRSDLKPLYKPEAVLERVRTRGAFLPVVLPMSKNILSIETNDNLAVERLVEVLLAIDVMELKDLLQVYNADPRTFKLSPAIKGAITMILEACFIQYAGFSLPVLSMTLLLEESQEHTRAIHIPRGRFNLMAQSYLTCDFHFRFKKNEIQQLKVLLEIPDPIITPQRYNASAEEALCILLNRFTC
ncbi:hypothetical protein B5M09_011210 [Aphanomyces astaci]|uniref:Uncharacterized protein n=1 Tax=Aphanomyces astaci TaxID=112090 RepID=A0A425DCE2_APHAT|nr:hypothetical protein B5M09_011210 [Aphanomyces astaci]